ncbi:putative oxidoreductase [BD1-7 clade bacterium]|uniref:Putative oxidoreductase n=1 Tax=BD1-7 clade bacterium TaxID=2029982 RepID=A0A5S9P6X4_9GAMM|nr:putative oxidoreductase [BD1-7 clade bacterium]CAA0099158.1 putative oxidoreductase [BD1-7 clade bacterium]
MNYFSERYGPWAIIAGASQGIGEQFSRQLAAKGINLIMIARGLQDLQRVAEAVRSEFGVEVETCSLDLAATDLPEQLEALTGDREIGLVVYNATYSYIGPFHEDTADSRQLSVDVNCRGPLVFIDAFSKPMAQRKRGGIILVSSMSGFQGSALVSTYAATKSFVTTLAEGLWEELRHDGIDVVACVAGATRTPNFNRLTPADRAGSAFPMEPEDVVSQSLVALENGKGPTYIIGRINNLVAFVLRRCLSRRGAVEFLSKATRKLYS